MSGEVHRVLKFSLHDLKGVLFVDSAVFSRESDSRDSVVRPFVCSFVRLFVSLF